MSERLRSYGELSGVEIFRYEGRDGGSGVIFAAEGMLITARHVVDERTTDLPGFEFLPEYDPREIDIAVERDPNIWGPKLGYIDKLSVPNCYCITPSVEVPEMLVRVSGSLKPFYEPTLLSRFVPEDESNYALFVGGTSGSPIMCQGKIIGLIKGSRPDKGIVVGVCFNQADLRAILTEFLGLSFEKIEP